MENRSNNFTSREVVKNSVRQYLTNKYTNNEAVTKDSLNQEAFKFILTNYLASLRPNTASNIPSINITILALGGFKYAYYHGNLNESQLRRNHETMRGELLNFDQMLDLMMEMKINKDNLEKLANTAETGNLTLQ